ncbi:MAG: HEAT repeat domain-containing protein [Anaerolineae bacterium]|nr:HEAT repeat domain-containing protein [Anaerolineae bacterium]
MYDDILELLQSSNPKDRIQAIKEIARTEDPSLLKELARVHKEDHDPEVREVALKAGRYIRSKQREFDFIASDATVDDARIGADGEIEYDMTDDAASIGDLTRKKKKNKPMVAVSAAAEKRAKGLVDRAMNFSMSGKNDMAAAELRKAFQINPNLADDEYTMTLASEVLGLPKEEAADELMYNEELSRVTNDGITWETALADLATYGLVTAIIVFVGVLLMTRVFGDAMYSYLDYYVQDYSGYADPMSMQEMEVTIQQISNPSVPGLLLVSLMAGFFAIFGQLIWYSVLHFVSTNFMSGMGSFRKLIHGVTPFYSIVTVIQALIYGVMFFFAFRGMGDIFSSLDGSFEQQLAVSRSVQDTSNLLQLIGFVFSIGALSYLSKLLGEVYDYGSGKGCVSIFLTGIMMVVLACGCSFLFTAVAGNLFNNMMMGMSAGM